MRLFKSNYFLRLTRIASINEKSLKLPRVGSSLRLFKCYNVAKNISFQPTLPKVVYAANI